MKMKGLDKLVEKIPAYSGYRIILLPLWAMTVALLGYVFLLFIDIAPRICTPASILLIQIEPVVPILGSLIISVTSSMLLSSVWKNRDDLRERFGALAYQRIIPRGLSGIALIATLFLHTATDISTLPPVRPLNSLTTDWSRSLLLFIGVTTEMNDIWVRIVLSVSILTLGTLTMYSALMTFGIDYMAIVYLYFPEESDIQDNEIYSVMRHPTYFGILLLGLAAFMFQFSVYSAIMFTLLFAIIRLQIVREERELIERFGQSYLDYRSVTPALHVPLRKMGAFFRFIIGWMRQGQVSDD